MPKKTLYEICEQIYSQGGQSSVFDFINAEHLEVDWRWCEPCMTNSPADPKDNACLVCGSSTEEAKDDTAEWM